MLPHFVSTQRSGCKLSPDLSPTPMCLSTSCLDLSLGLHLPLYLHGYQINVVAAIGTYRGLSYSTPYYPASHIGIDRMLHVLHIALRLWESLWTLEVHSCICLMSIISKYILRCACITPAVTHNPSESRQGSQSLSSFTYFSRAWTETSFAPRFSLVTPSLGGNHCLDLSSLMDGNTKAVS